MDEGTEVSGVEHGEPANFDEVYRSQFTRLVVLATAVLGRRDGADDVVQDAMLDAHRRWQRLQRYDAPEAWLRRVVLQRSIKVARKRSNEATAWRRRTVRPAHDDGAPGSLDPELAELLGGLAPQQRAALALHYLEDLSVQQVATLLGVSDGTVKTHLSRGRTQLAAALAATADRTDPTVDGGGQRHG